MLTRVREAMTEREARLAILEQKLAPLSAAHSPHLQRWVAEAQQLRAELRALEYIRSMAESNAQFALNLERILAPIEELQAGIDQPESLRKGLEMFVRILFDSGRVTPGSGR